MTMRYKWFVLISVVRISFALDDYCPEGLYGNNCKLTCPEQCRPLQTFPCNKKTGRCSEGCNVGYHGDQCDKLCSCPSGVCFQENGDCYGTGTATVRSTKSTTKYMIDTSLHTPVCDGVGTAWRTAAVIFIVLFFILLIGVLAMFLDISRKLKKKDYYTTVAMTREKDPFLPEERGEPDLEAARGDQAEEKVRQETLVYKRSTEVEELRRKNMWLKRDRAESKCEEMKQYIKSLEFQRDRAESKCEDMKQYIESLESQDKENQRLLGLPKNSKNHLMNNDKWLQCPNLEFDKEMVNFKVAQIEGNSVLLNNPDTGSRASNMKRFQNFRGTTCTEPLVKSGFDQYFEAVFDIDIKQPIEEGEVVMQLGFCKENDRNKTPFLEIKKKCFVVEVVKCKKHNKICLVSFTNGETEHIQELMENRIGSREQIMIGICLDKSMKKIKVYDGVKLNVLHKADINIGDKIWPMFGVCDERSASVSVRLTVGDDISMEKEKKEKLKSHVTFY